MIMRWLKGFGRSGSGALSDSEKCWICGAASPELVAAEVYRCRSCGRVQGEGAANFLTAERHRQIAALPREERLQRANGALGEAELALIACDGELETALRLAAICVEAEDSTRLEEAASRLASALLRAGQVEDLLNDTAVALALALEQRRTEAEARRWPAGAVLQDARNGLRRVAALQARRNELNAALRWQLDGQDAP